MYIDFRLNGTCRAELNTEVRFNIAGARADKAELVRLDLPLTEDERNNSRLFCCLTKVLRAMMRDGAIQFYVTDDGFSSASTEAAFLENKYHSYIISSDEDHKYVYVKM